jgi:hypothetical protein
MNAMKHVLLAVPLVVLAAGCQQGATRSWQQAELPTHDRQLAFDAARAVLAKHFEVTEANWVQGTLATLPQIFERPRTGTLADIRGAGGRWRRTVHVELSRAGLAITARAAVLLEREATEGAIAIAEAGGYGPRAVDVPRSEPLAAEPGKPKHLVWVATGYDTQLAREVLSEIAERAARGEKGEALPVGQSPKEAAEETGRIGAEPGR